MQRSRCESGAVPQLRCLPVPAGGRARSPALRRRTQPSEEGRFGGDSRRATSLRSTSGGFLWLNSRYRRGSPLLAARSSSGGRGGRFPSPTQAVAALADRLALADRDRGPVRDRRRQAGRSRSTTSRTTRRTPRRRSSPATRRTPRRSPRYKPDLVVALGRLQRRRGGARQARDPGHPRAAGQNLAGAYAQIERARQGNRARRGARRGHRAHEERQIAKVVALGAEGEAQLSFYEELSPDYYSATSTTFGGQVLKLLGLKNIADAADKTAPATRSSRASTSSRRTPT